MLYGKVQYIDSLSQQQLIQLFDDLQVYYDDVQTGLEMIDVEQNKFDILLNYEDCQIIVYYTFVIGRQLFNMKMTQNEYQLIPREVELQNQQELQLMYTRPFQEQV